MEQRLGAAMVAVLVTGALTGCTQGVPDLLPRYVDVPAPTTPAPATAPECPRDGVGLGAYDDVGFIEAEVGVAPANFVAVEVRHCVATSERFPPGPPQTIRSTVAEQISPVSEPLLTALALPDQEFAPLTQLACDAMARSPTLLLLIDGEVRAIAVRPPQDPCGHPREEVVEALAGLEVTDTDSYSFQSSLP